MSNIFFTNSAEQTQKLGEKIAKKILGAPQKSEAVVLGLRGDLGGGKTTFLQGFAKGLGIREKILSPTFVIMKCFHLPSLRAKRSNLKTGLLRRLRPPRNDEAFTDFYHIDCYRLKNYKDILELGFREIIKNPKNIVAIEWPEKIEPALPEDIILIKFKFINDTTRELTIKE